jgi:Zn-dependent protease
MGYRVFGLPVLFHWSFPLIGVGIGFVVGGLFFSTSAALAVQAFIWTTASVVVLVIAHELGHALAARAFSMRVNAIVIANISGVCFMDAFPSALAALIVSASGVLVQIALFALTVLLLTAFGAPTTLPLKCVVMVFTAGNAFIMMLNLLPYGARDGALMVRALRAMWGSR